MSCGNTLWSCPNFDVAIPLEPSSFVGDIWERDIRFIWEDLIDGASRFVSVVQPDPPHLAVRGTVATVIVHQHQLPDRALCNINVHTYIVLLSFVYVIYLFPLTISARVVDHQVPSILRPLAKRLTDAKAQVSSVCGWDEGTG